MATSHTTLPASLLRKSLTTAPTYQARSYHCQHIVLQLALLLLDPTRDHLRHVAHEVAGVALAGGALAAELGQGGHEGGRGRGGAGVPGHGVERAAEATSGHDGAQAVHDGGAQLSRFAPGRSR